MTKISRLTPKQLFMNFLLGKKHVVPSQIFVKKMVHAKKVTKLTI